MLTANDKPERDRDCKMRITRSKVAKASTKLTRKDLANITDEGDMLDAVGVRMLFTLTLINYDSVFTVRRICIARTMPWKDVCPSIRVCPSVTRRYSV